MKRRLNHPRPSGRGFTLVELLVVIAIIGILIGLLLPAVQAVRAAARRVQCSNNLKQIGLGLLNYHDSNKAFPAGAYWYGTDYDRYRGSILIRLLPFIEQKALYDAFDFNKRIDDQTFPDGTLIGATIVPTYVCPSDNNSDLYNGRAIHNYAASKGPTRHINSPTCGCGNWDSWNQFALAPYDNPDNFAGPFSRQCVNTRIEDCTDGCSNTIYFGEVRRQCSAHIMQGWARSNNGNGLVSTQIPINYNSCNDNATDGCERPCNWNTELGFKSLHAGGAHFVFGDGSVHFLSENIDHWNYQYLGAKADGQPVKTPD